MRTSVGELVAELQKLDQTAEVRFQILLGKNNKIDANGMARVDNYGKKVVVVAEDGA